MSETTLDVFKRVVVGRPRASGELHETLLSKTLALPIFAADRALVVLAYTQTVQAYEPSGGAYVVARDNLGTLPSLVAAAALLADYILTVAVSVVAGSLEITCASPS